MADLPNPSDRGSLVIADKVVERIAAIAAGEIEAVSDQASGWTRALRRSLPRASAKVAGGRTRVVVDVAAPWPTPLTSMAIEVRDHVRERVTTLTGVTVTAVDVTVADVIHAGGNRRSVQ
ncbi:MAG: Asp23/Gls24 family envelope stress response protein [Marmoricola sp.]